MKKGAICAALLSALLLAGCAPAQALSASVEQTPTAGAVQSAQTAQSAPPEQDAEHGQGTPEDTAFAQAVSGEAAGEVGQIKVPPATGCTRPFRP